MASDPVKRVDKRLVELFEKEKEKGRVKNFTEFTRRLTEREERFRKRMKEGDDEFRFF
jgi:hypothetical protein